MSIAKEEFGARAPHVILRLLRSRQNPAGNRFSPQISDLEKAVERIRQMDISDEEKRRILGENAAELLKL